MNELQAIRYQNGKLELLNQLLLPHQLVYEDCSTCDKAFNAIREMKVRGAPAIAITAVLALASELKENNFFSKEELKAFVFSKLDFLCESRPTAVNLFKMAETVKNIFSTNSDFNSLKNTDDAKNFLICFAQKFFFEDIKKNKSIGEYGAQIFSKIKAQKLNILTHCNTGSLATAGYGTALGVIRSLNTQQRLNQVYATETRPYNQGARLTSFELVFEKIPSTLITDSMVAFLMKSKSIDAVVVGADRVASNGDTANKIGTYQIALSAAYHNIPFYIAAPSTSIDLKINSGDEIHIEERPKKEVTHIQNVAISASGIDVWNPSFDITPSNLITGIITEYGVFHKKENNKGFNLREEIKNWI